MNLAFINPNLILQKNDIFTTGIVFMPFGLAYFVGEARAEGYHCQVIDAFGSAPNQHWTKDEFVFRGLTPQQVVSRIEKNTDLIFFYAINLTYHQSLIQLIQAVRKQFPDKPLAVLENSQAVTAYSLRKIQDEFYDVGIDFVITGEPEQRALKFLKALAGGWKKGEPLAIDGIGYRVDGHTVFSAPATKIQKLDDLAFPAWDLFPLNEYWNLKYAHGPLSASKYLPILTSRGCPYTCRFCVIPETNDLKWRARSPTNVVDEIEHFYTRLKVKEFHIEDVDPTIDDARIRSICDEIIRRKLKISWKICAGTKVETIRNEETLELMAQAGCTYISISPESGSPKVMKLIKKPFKLDHAIKLIKKMNQVGISSQACFVLGFPGEEDEDREMTRKMALDLTIQGLDEIAIFIVTPVPGSQIHDQFSGYSSYSQLNFSPSWRVDYDQLNRFRVKLYRDFLIRKLFRHPLKILKQCVNFLTRRFATKMEMTPFRAFHVFLLLKRLAGKSVEVEL